MRILQNGFLLFVSFRFCLTKSDVLLCVCSPRFVSYLSPVAVSDSRAAVTVVLIHDTSTAVLYSS